MLKKINYKSQKSRVGWRWVSVLDGQPDLKKPFKSPPVSKIQWTIQTSIYSS